MVQTVITDGGIVSEPTHYFRENEETYRYIGQRLDGTRETYLEADKNTRLRLLFDSATYALLTANVPLEQADTGFKVYRKHFPNISEQSLASDLSENGVGLNKNKSSYIKDNQGRMNTLFADVDDALLDGRGDEAQSLLMEAKGLGPAKSAFALAMLGFTDHACLDTHVCQYLGIDPRTYDKFSADEYKSLVDEAFNQVPDLRGEISPFLLQWLLFDLNRGEIETHDLWFNHVYLVGGKGKGLSASRSMV